MKDNIAAFGGDPDRITIYGVSAGGWSVSAHMVSPLSKGLFTRAISQSGSLYGLPMHTREERAAMMPDLAAAMGCPAGDEAAMLACLRGKPAQELHDVSLESKYLPPSCPTYGDDFFPKSITELYDTHQIHPGVDYIMGVTSDEGGLMTMINPKATPEEVLDLLQHGLARDNPWVEAAVDHIANMYLLPPGPEREATMDIVKNYYIKDYNDKFSIVRGLFNIFSDATFIAPTIGTAKAVTEFGSSVYVYMLDQAPSVHMDVMYPQPHLYAAPELKHGALHGMDMFYVMAFGLLKEVPMSTYEKLPEADKVLSRSWIHAWSTFAKTG